TAAKRTSKNVSQASTFRAQGPGSIPPAPQGAKQKIDNKHNRTCKEQLHRRISTETQWAQGTQRIMLSQQRPGDGENCRKWGGLCISTTLNPTSELVQIEALMPGLHFSPSFTNPYALGFPHLAPPPVTAPLGLTSSSRHLHWQISI
uniref:Uncharacterized protein n=1 Tax=Xenopus tropicalis TaxID=8364 RepID=A0A803JSV0_XENTR